VHPLIPWFEVPVIPIPGFPGGGLHGFGALVALGFVLGGNAAMDRASRLGLDREVINKLIGWLVVGTFIGGHVGYGLMYERERYFENPIEFLKVWQGLSSFGGFMVCVPLAVYYFYREKKPVWPFLDCLAYGMALGWFFGRMGCFVAHDHPGTVTDFWLGVHGICKPDQGKEVACHDLGLYEALWSITMFGLFTWMDRARAWKPGTFVLTLGMLYGPFRFYLDFFRPEVTDNRWFGYTPAQYGSALVTIVCIAAIANRLQSSDPPIQPAAKAPENAPA
jgi:phosphatidylglycerol---prolipoprotein diacylglyceryl transferase